MTIYEKNDCLGGIYVYDKKIKAYGASKKVLDWFKHTIDKCQITVCTDTYVEDISMLEEDIVICATGQRRDNSSDFIRGYGFDLRYRNEELIDVFGRIKLWL